MIPGRTTALYGLTGTGKTTQGGEYAKYIYKTRGKRTRYWAVDMGGFDSISHLEELGILEPHFYTEESDPWTFIADAVGQPPPPDIGLDIYDSGTSLGEACLAYCSKAAAKGVQIGQQKTFKLTVPTKDGPLNIGTNNESQYGLVQSFMLDQIWRSTWQARKYGLDVLWTFGEHRASDPNDAPIVGPLLAGKALTGKIPKWLRYTLRLVTETDPNGGTPKHVLYCQEKSELGGLGMSFANARYPLNASTPLPASIEPASLITFWELLEQGHQEALQADRLALGL